MDLETAVNMVLIDTKPQRVTTNIKAPLMINGTPHGALLVGRSSSSMRGLTVIPGLIDADFTGVIEIMVQTLFPPIHVPRGSKIAQLIPLTQLTQNIKPISSQERNEQGFGSTGNTALLTMAMNRRPTVSVIMENRGRSLTLLMLLDTGADLTIVEENAWPQEWPTKAMDKGVEGVGGHSEVRRSTERIAIIIEKRKASTYVTTMSLPNGVYGLIGRDVLDQLGVVLTTEKNFY